MARLTKDGDTDVWTDRKARLRWRVSNCEATIMPGYDLALLCRAQSGVGAGAVRSPARRSRNLSSTSN